MGLIEAEKAEKLAKDAVADPALQAEAETALVEARRLATELASKTTLGAEAEAIQQAAVEHGGNVSDANNPVNNGGLPGNDAETAAANARLSYANEAKEAA